MYYKIFFLFKKLSILVFALLLVHYASAQQARIDSLKNIISTSKGKAVLSPLIELVREVGATNNVEALKFATQANEISFQYGDTSYIVLSSRMMGQLLNRLSRSSEAKDVLLQAIPIAERNNLRSDYKIMLNNLALAYTMEAQYDDALEINFKTLQLREQDNDLAEITVSLNNIGLVYFKLRNYAKALEFYQRALKIKIEIDDNDFLDRLYVNIGLCYNQLSDFKNAHEYFADGFRACGDNCSPLMRIEGNYGLGVSYYGLGEYDKALSYFQKSMQMAREINNKRFEAEALVFMGKINIQQGNFDQAREALLACEKLSIEGSYNEILIDSYRQFSLLFNNKRDFKNAAFYQNKYISLKDSIYNERLIDKVAQIQTNYAERQNLATIAAKNSEIQRQRTLTLAIIIIAILASLLIFVLYRSNRIKKKVNAALSEAKAIIEDQNRQLLSSNIHLNEELKEKNVELEKANESLRRVNEELDNFIYKTSHDIRGPLASLKGMCNVALMDVKDPVALNYLRKLDITAEKLNTILTRLLIVNQINNSTLSRERIDFPTIVNDVLMLEKKKGLPPRLQITNTIGDNLEYFSDREFVRIILENLIDNAIKFYNDSERIQPFVDIQISATSECIRIRVIDNGIGISEAHPDKIFQMFSRASERSETGGIGLYITKTAVEKLRGSINLKTTPQGYTEFSVLLPLSAEKEMASA